MFSDNSFTPNDTSDRTAHKFGRAFRNSGLQSLYRVSQKKASIKNLNSDLLINLFRTVLICLYSVDLQVLFDALFVLLTCLKKIS